jgi:hypothetical protein
VIFRCEKSLPAEFPHGLEDPAVIRRHQDTTQARSLGGALIDMLYHGFAADAGQRFSRETGGSIASRDDGYNGHESLQTLEKGIFLGEPEARCHNPSYKRI